MKRKVIKQGNGTLTMTLPKKWTAQMGLTGESELDVEESGSELIVSSSKAKKGQTVEITLESNNTIYIRQIIRNVYLGGHDEIYVRYFDSKSIKHINQAVDELIGFHVIEQSDKGCLIKNLSSVMNEEFSVLLRKVFLLNKNLLEMLCEDLKKKKLRNTDQIRGITKNIHQFGDYCRRTIFKRKIFDDFKAARMYVLITRLISIANTIEYLYEHLSAKNKLNITKNELDLMKKTHAFYVLLYDTYYNKKIKDIPKLSIIKGELNNKLLPELLKKKNQENILLLGASQIIKDTARNGGILFTLKQNI